jgi:hypothetical protein
LITLPCNHCQKTLTLDEAFAGGVCRCQHCGSIQTVPANLKKGGRGGRSGPPAKTLHTPKSRTGDSGISAGISDDSQPVQRAELPELPPRRSMLTWIIFGGVALVVIVAFLWFAMQR